jgi:hypothetical protein
MRRLVRGEDVDLGVEDFGRRHDDGAYLGRIVPACHRSAE